MLYYNKISNIQQYFLSATMQYNKAFYVFWIGQTTLIFSSILITFSLGIWIYEATGSYVSFGILISLAFLPELIISPFAGYFIDKYPRKKIIRICTIGQIVNMGLLFYSFYSSSISISIIYSLIVIGAVFGGIHRVTYNSCIALFSTEEKQLRRFNGLAYLGISLAHLCAPLAAGVLIVYLSYESVVLFALAEALLALLTLQFVACGHLSPPRSNSESRLKKPTLLNQATAGFSFFRTNRPLRAYLVLHCSISFFHGCFAVLFPPMILTISTPDTLGILRSTGGFGMLVGGLLLVTYTQHLKKIPGIITSLALSGILVLVIGISSSLIIAGFAIFFFYLLSAIQIVLGYTQWQNCVPKQMTGRVFSIRDMAAGSSLLSAYLLAPWIAEVLSGHSFPLLGQLKSEISTLASNESAAADTIGLVFLILGIAIIIFALGMAHSKQLKKLDR